MAAPDKREIDRAIAIAFRIRGLYGKREARFLYRLARRRGNLVEIGCWHGRTTAILVQAAKVWGAHLTTIDPFGKEHMPPQYAEVEATPEKWAINLKKVGLEAPELLARASRQALKDYDREIALLFVDGNHTYSYVRSDLRHWASKICIGGYLVLHDHFYPGTPGVVRAVADWWNENHRKWRYVNQVQWTIAFGRLK